MLLHHALKIDIVNKAGYGWSGHIAARAGTAGMGMKGLKETSVVIPSIEYITVNLYIVYCIL